MGYSVVRLCLGVSTSIQPEDQKECTVQRILGVGLDSNIGGRLSVTRGFELDPIMVERPEELEAWLADGTHDVCILGLMGSGLSIPDILGVLRKGLPMPPMPVIGICPSLVGANARKWPDWSLLRASFLNSGGDDLLKGPPIYLDELLASIGAVLRRLDRLTSGVAVYVNGGATIEVNFDENLVGVNGKLLSLTRKEAEILCMLASRPGKICSKTVLL